MDELGKFIVDQIIVALEVVLDEAGRCQTNRVLAYLLGGTLTEYYNNLSVGINRTLPIAEVPEITRIASSIGEEIHPICVVEAAMIITCNVLNELDIEDIITEANSRITTTIDEYCRVVLTGEVPKIVAAATKGWFRTMIAAGLANYVFDCSEHSIDAVQTTDPIFEIIPG